MMASAHRVFGIGFHKTGTKSLGQAFSILGYRLCPPFNKKSHNLETTVLKQAMALAEHYTAFEDNPWPILFRALDEAFPQSKFVLTYCHVDEWYDRVVRYFGQKETPMRQWIYGQATPIGHEAIYKARYERHLSEVRAYFAGRPDNLYEFPLIENPSWEGLCTFLGKDIPATTPFPHLNRSS